MKCQEILTCVKLLSIIVIFFNGTTSALRVDIVPETVDDLSTDAVTITCRATESPDGTRNVVLMELGKRGEHPLITLGKTKLKYGANKNNNMEAQGNIKEANTSQSYLRLIIKNPEMENGGVYVCRLFYVDVLGELNDVTAYGNMTVQSSSKTYDQLKEELFKEFIQNLTDKVTSLEKAVTDQAKQLQEQSKHSKEQDAKVSAKISELSHEGQINHGLIQNLTDKDSFVSAFSAGYDFKDTFIAGDTLVFSQSILDVGHDYNTTTGVFTAPRRGLYLFNLVVMSGLIDGLVIVDLQTNGQTVATVSATDKDFWDQSSLGTVLSLQAGDDVKPVVDSIEKGNVIFNRYSLFNGCLLQQL